MIKKKRDQALAKAIELSGGVAALSKTLGLTSQAISQWRRCPTGRVLAVESATDKAVPREKLRPDIYPVPATTPASTTTFKPF
ncbi:MAG: helix-turn-helix domain-containing protein [Magnetovibrio sp.]|nr:helix-turn-helix domain-containing protein [Magnetovibrio sp.]